MQRALDLTHTIGCSRIGEVVNLDMSLSGSDNHEWINNIH